MTKLAIEKINAAETEAKNIRAKARLKAKQMITDTEKNGAYHCAEVEKNTTAELSKKIEEIRVTAEKLIEKRKQDAMVEVAELEKNAKLKMRAAIKEIVYCIGEQCQ